MRVDMITRDEGAVGGNGIAADHLNDRDLIRLPGLRLREGSYTGRPGDSERIEVAVH